MAIAIGWKIRSTRRRSGTRRLRPAPASSIRPGSAKPTPARSGCRTPGRSFPNLKLTLGGRLENLAGAGWLQRQPTGDHRPPAPITVLPADVQPRLNSTNFSPKASLSYDPNKDWNITANFGEAYRYPTVTELYQNVTVAGVATFANPSSGAGAGFHRRIEHRAPLERRPCPADAVRGKDQQRDHFADQPRDQCHQRPRSPTTTIEQRRRDPDAGCRTVGRQGQRSGSRACSCSAA